MVSRTYRKWESMIGRCYRESHPAWKYYGGRGIEVCERWRESYGAFKEDMGEAPEGKWMDRIDNNKGYEPGNCRWVTPKESAAKRRSKGGVKPDPGSLRQRALAAGIAPIRVYQRVRAGWDVEKALSVPVQERGGMTRAKRVELGVYV